MRSPSSSAARTCVEPGIRAVPSLKYLQAVPQFTEHYFRSDDDGDESVDNGPTGGLTWDGRVDRGRDQARVPLMSPFEMANGAPADVVTRCGRQLRRRRCATYFGATGFSTIPIRPSPASSRRSKSFSRIYDAFYPYSSKYDAYLAGRSPATEQEARGLALFNDPEKGNCANCHAASAARTARRRNSPITVWIAVGVPRNRDIPANAGPDFFDLGLCGPLRTDLAGHSDYCGRFMTPTLRNVALRQTFFHNGKIHSLRDAIAFYVGRDTDPGHWYSRDAEGRVRKFDDLPAAYSANINVEPPFGGKPGDPPRLSSSEFDKRGVKIIGLSVDPVDNHKKWASDIKDVVGFAPNYPMIGDTDLKVSKLYGMLPAAHAGTSEGRTPADNQTVRNVFVIGPDKKIKLVLVYPMTTGRNFDEVLRVVDSLQLTTKHRVATPANWKQGEDVILTGAVTDDEAKKLYPQGWKTPKPYIRVVPQPKQ